MTRTSRQLFYIIKDRQNAAVQARSKYNTAHAILTSAETRGQKLYGRERALRGTSVDYDVMIGT